jgi:hypothetical protein
LFISSLRKRNEGVIIKFLKKKEEIINIAVLILVVLFLFSYFKPELLLSKTITTGGDMASHYYTADYMKNYLLPHGKVSGWTPGNYAGFPILNFYFSLPFVLMALLSYIIPLEVSFKLITILGILSLPFTTFFFFKLVRFRFPIPVIAATFSLFFIFIEDYSMWGGNILSTLAGEFTYSIGLSLSILFLGTLYKGIKEKKYLMLNSVLLALIGLSHVYTLLFAGFSSFFFLLTKKDFKENFKYLSKIYIISFLLISFWILPLLSKLEYTTSYTIRWHLSSVWKLFPEILIPFMVLTVISLISLINKNIRKDKRIYYLFFPVLVGIFFYLTATKIGVVDIRFIPFIHLFIIFTGVFALDRLIRNLKLKWVLPIIFIIITILWIGYNEKGAIDDWIKWNYEGFEDKKQWPIYDEINQYLKGNFNDPRVVYEHAHQHNRFGTTRAFESLPLFTNRATLEGVYMQSSISAPFIFYLQSEISKQSSCPFPNYKCSPLNLDNGAKHLKMFNVNHFIVISEEVKKALKNNTKFKLLKRIDEYEIYELTTNKGRYVEVPEYEPVVFETDDWKNISYEWFKRQELLDIPLVFVQEGFEYKANSLEKIPKIPINISCVINEAIKQEEIFFTTTCLNKPHIIKMSYFPNWKVEGAEKIYLVSPSFMLIYPEKNNVRIYYGKTKADIIGALFTILMIIILLFHKKWKKYF